MGKHELKLQQVGQLMDKLIDNKGFAADILDTTKISYRKNNFSIIINFGINFIHILPNWGVSYGEGWENMVLTEINRLLGDGE